MSSNVQNLVVVLGVVIIAALGYYLYSQNSAAQLSNDSVDNQVAIETDLFLRRLSQLKEIQLEGTLFANPRFSALVDFSEPINPQPVGRSNPFVPN